MKKIFLILCAVLAIWGCDREKSDKPVVKIGVSLPLSGDAASVGIANQKSMLMALSDWKDTKYRYELIFEDDRLQPQKAAIIAQKFAHQDKTNATVSVWGIAAPVMADTAQQNEQIHMTCAGLSDVSKPYYIFNNYTQYGAIADALIAKFKKEGIKKIVYVLNNNQVSVAQSDYIKKALEKVGIETIATELYNSDERDFRTSITKLNKLHADYWLMFMLMPGTKLFIEQFFQITGNKNLTSIDSFHEMPHEYYDLVEGLWYVKSANGTPEFAERFVSETGVNMESCVGNSYENINLLIWAYENTDLADGEVIPNNKNVAAKLYSVQNRNGAIGQYSIDSDGIIQSKASIEQIKNGNPVVVTE